MKQTKKNQPTADRLPDTPQTDCSENVEITTSVSASKEDAAPTPEKAIPHIHHHIVRQDRNVGRNRQYTTILLYVLFGILFATICVYFLVHTDTFRNVFDTLGSIASPILIGLVIAYLLNPLMEFCEHHLFASKATHQYNRARLQLYKAKLTYDHLRLGETPDQDAVEAAANALRAARAALVEGKLAVQAEEAARLAAFQKKRAKRQKPSFRKDDSTLNPHPKRALALLCAVLFFLILLTVFIGIILPQCIASVQNLIVLIRNYMNSLPGQIENLVLPEALTAFVDSITDNFDLEQKLLELSTNLFNSVSNFLGNLLKQLPALLGNTITLITNFLLGIFMAIYFLSSKEMLLRQVSLVTNGLFGRRTYRVLHHIAKETDRKFGKFVQGKLIDSLFMMVVCFTLFSIGGIPYAAMITLITVVTNLIPYFGPFIGAIPSGIIILIAEPKKVIVFILLILLIQQIEGNIIEPRILGNSMGLAPVWIMIAVLVMGKLFGLPGMILGVPVFSVIYTLVGEYLHKRLAKRAAQADDPLEKEDAQ